MSEPASVVIQTSFLGDTVLTTPLLAALAKRGPVDVVCTPLSATLLANHPAVREVIVYDKRNKDRGVGGFARTARALRDRRYTEAYLAQGSVRSGALAMAARIPTRVGFATSAGRLFYSRRVPTRPGAHHAERLLSLAGESGASHQPRLYPGTAEKAAVDALLSAAKVSSQTPLAVLAPGSVWGTKRWPQYAELATRISRDARIVVVGSADDLSLATEIEAAVSSQPGALGPAVIAAGKLSLLASAELIARARVLVTNDSLPLHLASAMNTPTVAVFGPTVPRFGFGPLAERTMVVEHQSLDCRPCHAHGPAKCPLGHWRCMREVSVASVLEAARTIS